MAKKQFKAESKRLLDLMINSIYTHQEIFLREIISNASDAIDKLAYQALTDEKVGLSRSDFAIELKPDEAAHTLTVSDNGIGMDKDEMENNLGTICRSGSLQFKQALDKDKAADTDIIGQFGVGFYSAFMVADKVTVISKKYGSDEAWKWESEGADGYTMTPCERAAAGTDVIMQLKADTDDEKYSRFLKTWELQSLVRKYSDYIRYPIRMAVEKSRMKEGTEKSDKPEYETYTEVETLNSMVPIWNRNKKDVTDEEYNNFYKEKFFDFEDPLAVIHAKDDSTIDSIHEDLRHQILDCRDRVVAAASLEIQDLYVTGLSFFKTVVDGALIDAAAIDLDAVLASKAESELPVHLRAYQLARFIQRHTGDILAVNGGYHIARAKPGKSGRRISIDGNDLKAPIVLLHYRHADTRVFIRGIELICLVFIRGHIVAPLISKPGNHSRRGVIAESLSADLVYVLFLNDVLYLNIPFGFVKIVFAADKVEHMLICDPYRTADKNNKSKQHILESYAYIEDCRQNVDNGVH